jgi:hypothetical protein
MHSSTYSPRQPIAGQALTWRHLANPHTTGPTRLEVTNSRHFNVFGAINVTAVISVKPDVNDSPFNEKKD